MSTGDLMSGRETRRQGFVFVTKILDTKVWMDLSTFSKSGRGQGTFQ